MTHTSNGRALAIVAGLAFTYGSLIILMGDKLTKPHDWTDYNILTILTVFGVIAAGHQISTAWRDRQRLAAFGWALVFAVGTGLVVHNSLGRQAEASDTQTLSVEATNAALAAKFAELAKATTRRDEAQWQVDHEMAGRPDKKTGKKTAKPGCGKDCKDWKQRVTEVSGYITTLEAEIAALGPAKPVNAKADRMAEIAALFGADKAKAKAAVMLLEPFLWTVFFELGAIVAFGFAFRHGPRVVTANDNRPTVEVEPLPPATQLPPIEQSLTVLKGENVVEWSNRFHGKHDRWPKLNEIEAAFADQIAAGEFSRSTAYRRVKSLKAA
jgi:hypothetical protein